MRQRNELLPGAISRQCFQPFHLTLHAARANFTTMKQNGRASLVVRCSQQPATSDQHQSTTPSIQTCKRGISNAMRRFFLFSFCVLLFAVSCGLPPSPRYTAKKTTVRIGLMQHQDSVAVIVPQRLELVDERGSAVRNSLKGGRWLIRFASREIAKSEYRLLVATTNSHHEAFDWLHRLSDAGVLPELVEKKSGTATPADDEMMPVAYQVFVRENFHTREAAEERHKQLASRFPTEIVDYYPKPAKGVLLIQNLDTDQELETASDVQVLADRLTLPEVMVGNGFHWETKESHVYRSRLEFIAEPAGKLTVVNVLPVEVYLAGVVPAEMHPDFPVEALKAQAIAARTEVFFRLGSRHLTDGFDLCADTHCQVYGGVTREKESTTRAVAATAGLVLKRDGRVVEAVYHAVCGGQTEDNESVWNGGAQPHLRAVFDGPGRPEALGNTLTEADRIARWIETQPPVYCNTLAKDFPKSMEYAQKYFRWETAISREDLQKQIAKITGEDFGDLVDLVPQQRGRSGRITRLQVAGTQKTFEINSELTIRRALSLTTLWSSCFVVEKEMGTFIPQKFTLRGAGWGHGVGMCQVGAGVMAAKGNSFEAILKHYYAGVTIAKVK
jgi:SpoIID/LytB domain protein